MDEILKELRKKIHCLKEKNFATIPIRETAYIEGQIKALKDVIYLLSGENQ